MDAKQKKYIIIGLEVVLLVLLLCIIIIVSTANFTTNETNAIEGFNHSDNITSTSAEKIVNKYGNYTLETIHYGDGASEERLYLINDNGTELVSSRLIDKQGIVVGII